MIFEIMTMVINRVRASKKCHNDFMIKRRPGRLLNVSCTFSLRPLSTGIRRVNDTLGDLYEKSGFYFILMMLDPIINGNVLRA